MSEKQIIKSRMALPLNPVAGAVALAIGSMTLASTDVHASGGYINDEMVVTSTKRDSSVQDVPFNVSAFSGEILEEQRITDLNQLARWVPGLTVTNQGQRSANVLTARGLNASSIQASELLGNSGGGTVQTYLGDVPVYVDLQMLDIERVEVLIGPQGTLYGANTLGGAIRYIPKQPDLQNTTLDTHIKAYVQRHSDDPGYGGDLTFNTPFIPGVLGFRGSVGYTHEAGFIDYNYLVREAGVSNPEPDFSDSNDVAANLRTNDDANDQDIINVRGALLWNITDLLSSTLRYDYQHKEVGGRDVNHVDSFDTGEYVSGHRFDEPNDRDNHIGSLVFNWDLGDVALTSVSSYSKFRDDGQRDQTDFYLNAGFGYEEFPEFASFTRDKNEEDTLTQEIRLTSTNDSRFNWLVGGFYSKLHQDASSEEFTPGIPEFLGAAPPPLPEGDLSFRSENRDKLREVAMFGEAGYNLTDRWQATVGARWFDYKITTALRFDLPFFDFSSPWEQYRTSYNDTLFKFNTSYDLDGLIDGMSSGTTYLTISEGFRIGGVNPLAECPDTPVGACVLPSEASYDPDETTNYEIGIKSGWLDNDLIVNLAVYYIDWDNVQLEDVTANGAQPITVNGSDAQSYGTEFSSQWILNDNWTIYGSYAYNRAELTEDAPNLIGLRDGSRVDAFDGDRLPGTPESQGTVNINYHRPVADNLMMDIDYGFTSTSDVYTKTGLRGSGESLSGFTVHHLSAGISDETWSVRLFADNLFDKYAVTGVRNDKDYIDKRADGDGIGSNQFTLRRYYQNVIRPRTIGIDFRYRFDL